MGLEPTVLHYNYSAGIHAGPVVKWVLQWMDLSHYSVFLLLGTRAEWQRIAAVLAAWHCDRERGGPADQPQKHRQQSEDSIVSRGELYSKVQQMKFVLI